MYCVSIVSYSILINGDLQASFKLTRDIRQGDPLSSYLFILCAEVLSCLLHRAKSSGSISSVPIGRRPIHINHLFSTDDSLLLCNENSLEWIRLLDILGRLNRLMDKFSLKIKPLSSLAKVPQDVKSNTTKIARVRATRPFEKYLGLPTILGRTKASSFQVLQDRI